MLPLILSIIVSQGYAPTRQGLEPLDQSREARVQKLGKALRCAVCQGVSIADSPASMARAQLDKVRELVSEDKTDQEIFDYFVARYGEWVLLEPKKQGVTLGLWLLPVAFLLGGLALIISSTRRKDIEPPSVEKLDATSSDDTFLAQVRSDSEK